MKRIIITILSVLATVGLSGQSVARLEDGWKFAYGNAADPGKDFGRGTEYFNYLTKAASIHNEGPYVLKFAFTLLDGHLKVTGHIQVLVELISALQLLGVLKLAVPVRTENKFILLAELHIQFRISRIH